MITQKEFTRPESKEGHTCHGKITLTDGVGTFTIKGRDYSAKITGLQLTPFVAHVAGTAYYCQVDTIAYSASTGLTTVTIYVQKAVYSATDHIAFSVSGVNIDVYYSFWLNEGTLPTDLSTNDTSLQAY